MHHSVSYMNLHKYHVLLASLRDKFGDLPCCVNLPHFKVLYWKGPKTGVWCCVWLSGCFSMSSRFGEKGETLCGLRAGKIQHVHPPAPNTYRSHGRSHDQVNQDHGNTGSYLMVSMDMYALYSLVLNPFIDPSRPVGQPFLNAADVEISFCSTQTYFWTFWISRHLKSSLEQAAFVHLLQLKVSDWMYQSTTGKGTKLPNSHRVGHGWP